MRRQLSFAGVSATVTARRYRMALAMSAGLVASACGNDILTHIEPMGEKLVLACPFDEIPDWSFLPVEIQAETPGRQAADWRVTVSTMGYGNGSSLRGGFDFRAQAGGSSHGSALVPTGKIDPGDYGGNYITFQATHSGGGSGRGNLSNRSSASSNRYKTTLATKLAISLMGPSSAGLFHQDQAPGDWRAYCGYDHLDLTAVDWEAMTPAARTAIKHWVRLGGHLNLAGNDSGTSLADLGLPKPDSGQKTGAVSRGFVTAPNTGEFRERATKQSSASNDWAVRAGTGESVREWETRDSQTFVMTAAKLAAGFMLLVVVVFAILVGPINVFVLAAARRRHRLFFTTPLISLGAGGLLVISVVLSDGIGGKGLRYVWLENGPAGENTSYVMQHQHSQCGAMFATGFEIPEDAYFVPMELKPGELSGSFTVELAAGKVRAGGPWFSSRRSQNFYLAAARPSRGRIEMTGTDARPVFTSAFDFPLDRVFWLAPDGKSWWQAGPLAQGTATTLQPCTEAEVRTMLDHATQHAPAEYGRDLTTAIRRPGYFFALADGIAAIATHQSIKWQTHGFVTGPVVAP